MNFPASFAVLLLLTALPLKAAQIVVDFSHDTSGIFASLPGARSAIEAAAADLSSVLTGTPGALDDSFAGFAAGAGVEFRWQLTASNPFTGETFLLDPHTIGEGEIRIFVGLRNLNSYLLTSTLAQGGPGGAQLQVSRGGPASGLAASVAIAEAASNGVMLRGDGPVLSTFSGSVTISSTSVPFEVGLGLATGSLWFDQDTNNDGFTDTPEEMAVYWHFDHTSEVVEGKFDLYTVALHEMLHALGVGSSESWDELVSGTDWLGTQVTTLLGTGHNILDGDSHVRDSLLSLNTQGILQSPVIAPRTTAGQRHYLTALDIALLADIGWSTIPVPEPAVRILLGIFAALTVVRSAALRTLRKRLTGTWPLR